MAKNIIFFICICICLTGCQNKQELKDAGENIQIIENNISGEIGEVKNVDDNSSTSKIKILKKIDTSSYQQMYDPDWDNEAYKYPLEQKYLLTDTYENEKLGIEKLEVYFCGYEYDSYIDPIFEININNVRKEVISDGNIYVIDLDENDEYLEIAVDDYWENGCDTSVLRFARDSFVNMGSMNDALDGLEAYTYCNGKISDTLLPFLEETVIPKYYIVENNKLVMKFVTYEEVKDKEYTITEKFLSFIECYDKLQVGDKIKILSITDETEAIIFDTQGIELRVMNEKGEVFTIGYAGSWTL